MALLVFILAIWGSCLYFVFAALRTAADSDRLARRAELELGESQTTAMVDQIATESPVLDRAEKRLRGWHDNTFI